MKFITDKLYLHPTYLGEGFLHFFINLHRILLFTLFFILTSVPIITFGASAAAFNGVMREIAQDSQVKVVEYFRLWKQNFWQGIPYSFVFAVVVFLLSLPVSDSPVYYFSQFCAVMAFCLTLYYPITCNSERNIARIFAYSALYAFAHLLQMLMMLSLALIFLLIIAYTSEFLLLLFFPVFYFMLNRIVLANNKEIEQRGNVNTENISEESEIENKKEKGV